MALGDDMLVLGSLPGFRELEPDALRLVAFSGESRVLRRGDVMFEEGEPADGGFVLLNGSLSLQSGSGDVTVQAPAVVGASALLAATARPARAVAVEPCATLKIPRTLYHRVLTEFPDSAARVRQAMVSRVLEVDGELRQLGAFLQA